MKLEVRMYVRYKRGSNGYGIEPPQRIGQIAERINDSEFLQLDTKQVILESDVIKTSYNILDLIEVGDYANGFKVVDFDLTYFNGTDRLKEPKRIGVIVINGKYEFENYIKKEEIKSIVTKEQFSQMEYKIGE